MAKKIKFGLKLWSINTALIGKAVKLLDEKIFDYIELFVVPDTDIAPFLVDVPYVIHIPHHQFGVSIGEAIKKKHSLEKIRESFNWADKLDARYLILHAGTGSLKHASDFIKEISDGRLLIENMPGFGLNREPMIGFSPQQIEELIDGNDIGLCLDFGHAIKAASCLKKDYREYINSFLYLEPKIFHLSDGMAGNEIDEHLSLGDGDFDIEFLLGCTMKSSSGLMTLEIPRKNPDSFQEDLRNIHFLNNITYLG